MAPRSTYSALANWDGSLSQPQSRHQSVSPHIQGHHSAMHHDRREELADWSSISPSPRVQHGFAMPRSKDAYASREPVDPSTDPLLLSHGSALESEVEHIRSTPTSSYTYANVSELQKSGHANQVSIASLMAASEALRDRTGTSSFGTSSAEPSSSILDQEIVDLTLSDDEDMQVCSSMTSVIEDDHSRDELGAGNKQHEAHSEQRQQSSPRITIMNQSASLRSHREAITPQRSAYASTGRSNGSAVSKLAQWRDAREPWLDTSPVPATPASAMSRSMSTLNDTTTLQAAPVPHISMLERELSVVPATPESTLSQASIVSLIGSASASSKQEALERSPSLPSITRNSSSVGSTLTGALAAKAQSARADAYTEEDIPGSPLSTLSSLSEPLQRQVSARRNPHPIVARRRTKVLEVYVPSLSRERKAEYLSFDACMSQMQTLSPEKQSSVPAPAPLLTPVRPPLSKQLSAHLTHKRKREIPSSMAASASVSASNGPPRKKVALRNERRHTAPNGSGISATGLSLASLGPAAWDPLAKYCEYIPIEVNTMCEADMIYDRIPDPNVLSRVLWCALRHWREPVPNRTAAGRGATEQPSTVEPPAPTHLSHTPTSRDHTPALQPLSKAHDSLDALQGYASSSTPSPSPSPHAKPAASTPWPATLPVPNSRAASVLTPVRPSGFSSPDFGRVHPPYPPLTGTTPSPHRAIDLQPGQALAFAQAHQQLPLTQDTFSAVRGHDAFLGGGHEDEELFSAMTSQPPNDRETFRDAGLGSMSDPPWPADEEQHNPAFQMDEMFPSHGLSEFIDPMLLGGNPIATAPSRASPSPPPPETAILHTSPPRRQQHPPSSSSESEASDARSSSIERAPSHSPDSKKPEGKGKGKEPGRSQSEQTEYISEPGVNKGKEKEKQRSLLRHAKPHEYFGFTPDVNEVAGELSEQHILSGKRDRKLSKRVQDSIITSKEVANILAYDLPRASNAVSQSISLRRSQSRAAAPVPERKAVSLGDTGHRPPPSRKPKKSSGELTYCHQCRNKRATGKMRCTNGPACELRFCARCIYLRYQGVITFDASAVGFICPKCRGICNCTSCCARRGETYHTSKGVKVDWSQIPGVGAPSTSQSSTRKNKPGAKKRKRSSEDFEDVPVDPSMMLPSGATWGTVYGRDGRERMGVAVVVDNKRQEIALQPHGSSTAPRTKRGSHKFVGVPLKHWRMAAESTTPAPEADTVSTESGKPKVVHAYVGSRQPIYAWHHTEQYKECFEGDLTPDPSDSEQVEGDNLMFLVAKLVDPDGQNGGS